MALNGVGTTTQLPFTSVPTGETARVGLFGVTGRTPSPSGVSSSQGTNELWFHLNRSLLSLRDQASSFARPDLWNARTATSSDAAVVGASAQAEAKTGTYAIGVQALAAAEKLGGQTVSTTATPLGVSGDFTLNGKTISVAADDTLATLADKIGKSGANVQAKVESVEGGGYRLTLTSGTTGQAGTMTLADATPGTLAGLGFLDAAGQKANVLQAARDASFTVNGEQRTSSSNSVTVDGVSLELKQTTTDPVTVQVAVSHDDEALVAAAKKFAEAYNAAQDELGRTAMGGRLGSQSGAARIQQELTSALQGTGSGTVAAGGLRPREAGFVLEAGGSLTFDESAFRQALEKDRDAVAKAFTIPGGAAERVQKTLAPLTGQVAGYQPSVSSTPAASWVASQAFAGLTQSATPQDLALQQQAAALQQSLTLLNRQQSTLANQADSLFAALV